MSIYILREGRSVFFSQCHMNCRFSSSAGMIQVCQRICTYGRGQGLNLSQRKTVIVPTIILTHGFEHALSILCYFQWDLRVNVEISEKKTAWKLAIC